MSALAEYDTAGFIKKIGVKLVPKQVPTAVTKTEPPPKPQAPVESKPVKPDKNNFAQRLDSELDAQVELERQPDLFNDTPGGWENVQLVLDYVKENHDGYLSRASVQDAISTLRRSGELLTLFRPEPAKPIAKDTTNSVPRIEVPQQPVVTKQASPATIPDPEAGLPPISDYVKRALGSNKLRNRADVRAIPSQLFSDLYRGPYGVEFRNRVNAILSK